MPKINVKSRAEARSAPSRRRFIEKNLSEKRVFDDGTPAAFVVELNRYVDELEARVWRGDSDATPERSEDSELVDQLDRVLQDADFGPGFEAMVRKGLDAVEKFGPAIRKLSGILTFREAAAIACMAQMVRYDDAAPSQREAALQAVSCANFLEEVMLGVKGGAA